MGLLEDALRDTFSNRVGAPPAVDDLAGQAIRRAGAIRRRQVTVASVAVVVTVVLVGVGMLSGSPLAIQFGAGLAGPTPSPTATTPPPNPLVGVKLPVDVLNGDRIQVADGRVISLAGLGTAQKALRVSPGWLVQTSNNLPEKSAVWLVDEKGFASQLASGEITMVSHGTQYLPSPQVAWTAAGRLNVANFVGRGLSGTTSTTGADKLVPLLAVAGGLLLGGTQTGGRTDLWDMWYPDKGAYTSTPTSGAVSAVVGETADGKQLFILDSGKPPCLGLADPPPQFTMVRSTCGALVSPDDRIYASPTGRWLLVVSQSSYTVYDANTIWTYPQAVASGPVDSDPAVTGTWLNDTTFVVYGHNKLTQGSPNTTSRSPTEVPDANATGAKAIIEDVR
jgi:hypothetical protein